ncbi:MAG: LysR family transcriptional regulator [Burkholderiaceae bacterium]
MNLKSLQAFHLVVQQGSLAGAAKAMHLSPPAVSRLIRLLESETRLTLFSRARRRLMLTAEGEWFYREARHILQGIGEIPRIVSDIHERASAQLRVITSPPLGLGLMSPALALLLRDHPQVRCVGDIGSRAELETRVGSRHVDLGIASLPLVHSHVPLQSTAFCRARMVAAVPLAHPLAQRTSLQPADLVAVPLIGLRPGQLWRERADEFFRAGGVSPDYRVESESTLIAIDLCLRGVGIALLDRVCAGQFDPAQLRLVPLAPERWVHYGFVAPAGQQPSAVVGWFIDALRAQVAALADESPAAGQGPALIEAIALPF